MNSQAEFALKKRPRESSDQRPDQTHRSRKSRNPKKYIIEDYIENGIIDVCSSTSNIPKYQNHNRDTVVIIQKTDELLPISTNDWGKNFQSNLEYQPPLSLPRTANDLTKTP